MQHKNTKLNDDGRLLDGEGGCSVPPMPKSQTPTLGEKIKTLRDGKGWTTYTLADEATKRGAKVTQADVSRIENGVTEDPGISKIYAISRAFGVSLDELVEGTHVGPVELAQSLEDFLKTDYGKTIVGTPAEDALRSVYVPWGPMTEHEWGDILDSYFKTVRRSE